MSNRLSPSVFLDSVKNNILIKIKKPLLSSSDCLSGLPSLNVSLNMASNERDLFVSQNTITALWEHFFYVVVVEGMKIHSPGGNTTFE